MSMLMPDSGPMPPRPPLLTTSVGQKHAEVRRLWRTSCAISRRFELSRSICAIACIALLDGCAVGPYKSPGRIGDNKYELAYGADRYAAVIQIDQFCAKKGYARAAPIRDFGAAVVFSCMR